MKISEPAIFRRFEKRIYVPLPDSHGRFELFKLNVEKNHHTLTEQDYEVSNFDSVNTPNGPPIFDRVFCLKRFELNRKYFETMIRRDES